jgi:hypothetical protein
MVKANWWRPIPAVALLTVAVMLSSAADTPNELPGVTLGWPLLLHLERAAVLVAGSALLMLVGVRATKGQFPFKFGQIEYAVEQAATRMNRTVDLHEQRLEALEIAARNPERPTEVEQQI